MVLRILEMLKRPFKAAVLPVKSRTFFSDQAVEAIVYVASRLDTPTIHGVLKIFYFADQHHLAEYGATATGDEYMAMRFGPVASESYNLMKAARGDEERQINASYLELVADVFNVINVKEVVPLRVPIMELISPAARESFDWAITAYGQKDFGERTADSHDRAWSEAWNNRQDGRSSAQMTLELIAAQMPNASTLIAHLSA